MNHPTELEKKFAEAIVDAEYESTDHVNDPTCPWCNEWRGTGRHLPDCIVLEAKKVLEVEDE